MGFVLLMAVIALVGAWLVNAFIGILTGERPGGLLSDWWDIFSNAGRNPATYAEPLPDFLTAPKFAVGERVRILLLPTDLERSMSPERRELFQRCAGKVVKVEGVDRFGALELHVQDDGSQSPDRPHHVLFIEPQYVERVTGIA
jgi:hypothetical protein